MVTSYDVIILGGGAAGMSALLWCKSLNLNAIIFEQQAFLGGQLHTIFHPIDNVLGLNVASGEELNARFMSHVHEAKVNYKLGCSIESIDLKSRTVLCNGERYAAKNIVIATGVRRKKLEIPGEDLFEGKGIHYSASKDKYLFIGKKVCVVGGGDSAVEDALILSRRAKEVVLINRSHESRGRESWIRDMKKAENISLMFNSKVVELRGQEKIEEIVVEDAITKVQRSINIDGVLVRIGVVPNTEAFRGQIDVDQKNYVKVNNELKTSLDNVYAIGDVCRPIVQNINTAMGDGASVVKVIAAN